MAETIGRAYIRILADGSGLPRQVEREMSKADAAAEKGGQKWGDSASEGFAKSMSSHRQDMIKSLNQSVEEAVERSGVLGRNFGENLTIGIRNHIRREHPELEKVSGELAKKMSDAFLSDFALSGRKRFDFARRLKDALDEMRKEEDQFEAEWRRDMERIADSTRKALQGSAQDLTKFQKNVTKTYDTINTGHQTMARDWVRDHDTIVRELQKTNSALMTSRERIDAWALGFGRAFGKGSRNNFLNFFGSVINNVLRLPNLFRTAATGVQAFVGSIGKAFTDVGGGALGVVTAGGKIANALLLAGGGIAAFVIVLGTLTSALLLAAGAAAALASSIAFGLVGAIAPLVGLLGPLSLAIGGVATAFIGMSEAEKELTKEHLEPLKNQLKELGDAARPGILDGIRTAAENLEEPMKRLRPLFKIVGDSLGVFLDTASRLSFGPGFERFVEVMSRTLPDTMRSLGTIAGNTFDGLAGLFATLQPVTEQFLGALERISGAFADWSISPQAGTFFDKAADSASALLDFLGPVWDLTKEILDAGREPGNELFRSMGEAIQGWVDAVRENPDILRNFFEDAQRMGEAIGHAVVAIGKLIDALDTETTRNFAIGLIEGFADVVEVLAELIGWFSQLDDGLQSMVIWLGVAALAWGRFSTAIQTAQTRMGAFVGASATAQTRMAALGGAARTAAGVGGIALLGDALLDASQKGESLGGTLEGALGGAMLGARLGPIGALVGAVGGGGLTALVGAMQDVEGQATITSDAVADMKGFVEAKADADQLSQALIGVVDQYGNVARAAVEASFKSDTGEMDKDIATLRELGLSVDTLVSASQGSAQALALVDQRLGSALDGARQSAEDAAAAYQDARDGYETLPGVGPIKVTEERLNELKETSEGAADRVEQLENAELVFGLRTKNNTGVMQEHIKTIKDLTESLGITRQQYNQLPETVRTEFEERGLPQMASDVVRLIGNMKELRNFRSIKMLARLEGVNLTLKDIKEIQKTAKLTPRQVRILTRIENAKGAKRDLGDIGKRAKDLDRQRPVIRPDVDGRRAEGELKGLGKNARDLGKEKIEPKASLDKRNFDKGNKDVTDKLNDQDRKTVNPKITVNNTQAMQAINATNTALNNIQDETVYINVIRRGGGGGGNAAGGIFSGAQYQMLGEAGPEAIVPLSRPLAQVDPAVRELSAIAQGLSFSPTRETHAAGKVVNVGGINIYTPTEDPRAVAQEAVNRLVAIGY